MRLGNELDKFMARVWARVNLEGMSFDDAYQVEADVEAKLEAQVEAQRREDAEAEEAKCKLCTK